MNTPGRYDEEISHESCMAETAIHGQISVTVCKCVCCRLEFRPLTSLPVTLLDLGKRSFTLSGDLKVCDS